MGNTNHKFYSSKCERCGMQLRTFCSQGLPSCPGERNKMTPSVRKATREEAEKAINTLLRYVGEEPGREGLKETPSRVVKAWDEMLCGYNQDPKDIIKTFKDGLSYEELIVVSGIEFTSWCEHHWLPFQGVAKVGYIPNGEVIGLSKIPRVIEVFAKRLQVQERLTVQIVDALMEHLQPKGCGCIIKATHSCLSCRGIKKQKAIMTTSALRGVFKTDPSTKAEFISFSIKDQCDA